ncbi:MAG: hypothetical protein ACR2RB_10885 [Gammaproteobacteria bacterium]
MSLACVNTTRTGPFVTAEPVFEGAFNPEWNSSMYIDSQIKLIKIFWPPITDHTYERISRPKWRIQLNYACGAEMILEEQPDDMIQCLVLGAYNSGLKIVTNINEISADSERPAAPFANWKDFQPVFLEQ